MWMHSYGRTKIVALGYLYLLRVSYSLSVCSFPEFAGVGFEAPSEGNSGPSLSYRHPLSETSRVLELVSPGRYCYKISEKSICQAGHELNPKSGDCKPMPCRKRPPRSLPAPFNVCSLRTTNYLPTELSNIPCIQTSMKPFPASPRDI